MGSPVIFNGTNAKFLTSTANSNNFVDGYTTTATAAGTTTLTTTSTFYQYFTGSTTQTVTLPVVTTLIVGQSFSITNNSTGVITVNSSGANLVVAISAGQTVRVTCILATGTTAASWSAVVTAISASVNTDSGQLYNAGIAASVASNALTLSLTQADGATAPSTGAGAVTIGFRNSLVGNGSYTAVAATTTTSIVVPAGATLSSRAVLPFVFWLYAINNAGTIELAVSAMKYDTAGTYNTIAISSSSSSNNAIYSTTARTGVAIRLIGRVATTETVAGNWAQAPTNLDITTVRPYYGNIITMRVGGTVASTAGTAVIAFSTVDWDTQNAVSGGRFTAPISGYYTSQFWMNANVNVIYSCYINASLAKNVGKAESGGGRASGGGVFFLNAGDIIDLRADTTTGTVQSDSWFSVTLFSNNN